MLNSNLQNAVLCLALLAGGVASAAAPQEPMGLREILKVEPRSPDSLKIPQIRYNAIRETAVTYGAQAGLARRSFEIQAKLEKQASSLDAIYNFLPLMIDGNVVPPVLTETSAIYDQSSEDMLRVIGKVYRIEQQARFAYAPPNWRSYMLTGFDFDTNLVAAVAPQTEDEKALWRAGVEEGFKVGTEQAEEILRQNFATLKRDFEGMVLYHRMLDNGMVTKPYVASNKTNVGRSVDGSMHIGEVFMRITVVPDFVDESSKWKQGQRSIVQERLRRLMDPEQAAQMREEAKKSGRVQEVGR
jgi:defect-in-organelle-trafficking protein DotC